MGTLTLWIAFNLFVLLMLALDLGVFHRKAHAISVREAAAWSIFWVALSVIFNVWLWLTYGRGPGLEFLTGYLVEKSLSVDNIFVFLVLFRYFGVEPKYQHRVLFWGILGALVMRGAMIGAGVVLIRQYEWILYVFGAFLVWTGFKMMTHRPEDIDPSHNPVFRWARRVLPITKNYEGQSFFVRHDGRWMATPLFLVLLVVETTDLAFAVDSIPAIFGITQDPFIVYTSNVFAILGLRAFYFLLAGILPYFRHLGAGLSAVLIFIGLKMLGEQWLHISTGVSLAVVGGILTTAVIASLISTRAARKQMAEAKSSPGGEINTWMEQLASPDDATRQQAATALYVAGCELGDAAVGSWHAHADIAALFHGAPTVGVAVQPQRFAAIRAAIGSPRLADVPPDQDAQEFELHMGEARLDILTTKDPGGGGAIARFLDKMGEGVQQVEYPVRDVDRATSLVAERFGVKPIYPATRPGADGARVNFFFVSAPGGRKTLIELIESR